MLVCFSRGLAHHFMPLDLADHLYFRSEQPVSFLDLSEFPILSDHLAFWGRVFLLILVLDRDCVLVSRFSLLVLMIED